MFVTLRLGALHARVPVVSLLVSHGRGFAVKMRIPLSRFVVDGNSASLSAATLLAPIQKAKVQNTFVACTGSELDRYYIKASSSSTFPYSQDSLPVLSTSRKLAEVAFVGRSNVGKSSLINALLQAKLAATSQTPGHTKHLHFFPLKINGKASHLSHPAYLVDLPGVGYAKTSEASLDSWNVLIGEYIRLRSRRDGSGTVQMPPLRRVFFIIDSRRGVSPVDEAFLEFLREGGVPHQIVLTKIDRLRSSACLDAALQLAREHVASSPHCSSSIHLVSTKAAGSPGVRELRATIGEALKPLAKQL